MSKRKKPQPDPPAAASAPDLSHIAEALRPLAVPMDSLVLDPGNARQHGEANLKAIAASLQKFGQRRPLVVNKANMQIEAGNGTFRAAAFLGWTHLAVVMVDDDATAQHGYALADNRTAELAEWDDTVLATLIGELQASDVQLSDALLLSELVKTKTPADAGVSARLDRFQILVDCRDQKDQQRLDNELRRKGYATRKVTSKSEPALAASPE